MGIFAFKRMREQEAAKLVVSAPSKKKKTKVKQNGNHDRRNSRRSIS
jgi:hypothetical protein